MAESFSGLALAAGITASGAEAKALLYVCLCSTAMLKGIDPTRLASELSTMKMKPSDAAELGGWVGDPCSLCCSGWVPCG
jgi:hypothetical protein